MLQQKERQSALFESQKTTEDFTEAEQEELAVRKRREAGTPCNKENFERWQKQFQTEMEALQQKLESESDAEGRKAKKDRDKKVDKSGRLTGFQIFSGKQDDLEALEAAAERAERDEDEDDDEEDLEHIDEDLFDDDEDLDDLDFDDEEEEEELDI